MTKVDAGGARAKAAPAVLVGAVALAARVIWVLVVPTKPVGDFAMYRESAAHLVAHGALDPAFVYMPGYTLLLATVQTLGGGLLAEKMVGACLGALAAAAVAGVAHALFGRRAAWAAGLAAALWPPGIALASVTGTDMPAAALALAGWWALCAGARADAMSERGERSSAPAAHAPGRARAAIPFIAFGALMGCAAWMRAVFLPLAPLALLHARLVMGTSWRHALRAGALSLAAALLVLLPWALHNHARDGVWSFSDRHGGLTALVGADPNADGRFSRSLQRVWREVEGRPWLEGPRAETDAHALAMARALVAFEPAYAAGLVGVRLDRLLGEPASLLYWPIFRAGVLPPGAQAAFASVRPVLAGIAIAFQVAVGVGALLGLGAGLAGRRREVLVPIALASPLIAAYALLFAEARYGVPIVLMALPLAAWGWRNAWRPRPATVMAVVGGALLWAAITAGGAALVERRRFAAGVCAVENRARLCLWRATDRHGALSPVRGTWDGLVLRAPGAAATAIDLPAGRYRVRADLEPATATLRAAGRDASVVIEHPGGALAIELAAPSAPASLGGLAVTRAD